MPAACVPTPRSAARVKTNTRPRTFSYTLRDQGVARRGGAAPPILAALVRRWPPARGASGRSSRAPRRTTASAPLRMDVSPTAHGSESCTTSCPSTSPPMAALAGSASSFTPRRRHDVLLRLEERDAAVDDRDAMSGAVGECRGTGAHVRRLAAKDLDRARERLAPFEPLHDVRIA